MAFKTETCLLQVSLSPFSAIDRVGHGMVLGRWAMHWFFTILSTINTGRRMTKDISAPSTTCLQEGIPRGKGDDNWFGGRKDMDGDEEVCQKHTWGTFSSFSPFDVIYGEERKRARVTKHIAPTFNIIGTNSIPYFSCLIQCTGWRSSRVEVLCSVT